MRNTRLQRVDNETTEDLSSKVSWSFGLRPARPRKHNMSEEESKPTPSRANCDDCGQPIRSVGIMLYGVRGPNPGPPSFGSNYYSVDLTVSEIGGHLETRRLYVDSRAQR